MSDTTKSPAFVFSDLSEPARAKLEAAFEEQRASNYLIVGPGADRDRSVYGELVAGTVVVIAAKIALPIVAAWLIRMAPPKPRKETIEVALPDGTRVKQTIEYSKAMSVADLAGRLAKLFDQDVDK